MFERLENILWHEVRGPYGTVADLPRYMRGLTSEDASECDASIRWLWNNLIHQGTRSQATPSAVPFLFELLDTPATRARHEIVRLVLSLAVDGDVPPVPNGFDPDTAFAAVKDVCIDPADVRLIWTTENWGELDDRLQGLLDVIPTHYHHKTYVAVEHGAALLVRLTTDADPAVRREAVWALGWFPRVARDTVGPLRIALSRESDDGVLANMLLVLGLLDRYVGDQRDVPMLESCLIRERRPIVRRAATLALGTVLGPEISAEVLDMLIAGTEEEEMNLKADTELLGWSWVSPSLRGCYWRVLHAIGL